MKSKRTRNPLLPVSRRADWVKRVTSLKAKPRRARLDSIVTAETARMLRAVADHSRANKRETLERLIAEAYEREIGA